jgi:hypothetical protein
MRISRLVRVVVLALSVGLLGLVAPTASQAAGPTLNQSNFDASKHTFLFPNSWNATLRASLPVVGTVNFGTVQFGLCGGMSFAAADSHHARAVTPRISSEPGSGSLRNYIMSRQIDSLTANGASALRRFLEWQQRPQNDKYVLGVRVLKGLTTLTKEQYANTIRPRLSGGNPVPLGMVKVSGMAAPWRNHQVLAIGFRNLGNQQGLIAVYDPNYPISPANPDGITFLNTKTRKQYFDAAQTSPTGDTFRGVFATPYSKRTPPWAS